MKKLPFRVILKIIQEYYVFTPDRSKVNDDEHFDISGVVIKTITIIYSQNRLI